MPRRHSEVADIGFSFPGLSSDLQDVTKQQQKAVWTRVQFAPALQQRSMVPRCSSPVVLRLSHGHGKVLVETGSENPGWVGSELAGTLALG